VGPGIATRLGFTQLTYVSEIINVDTPKSLITVRREIDGGSQVIEAKMPALLTVELELGAPVMPLFRP
jgi:electron transfer flavoprotein beta subunit